MIFFLRVASAVASVEAYFVDQGYFADDWRYEQKVLRDFFDLQKRYGEVQVPSYFRYRFDQVQDE